MQIDPTGLSREDTRRTLIRRVRSAGLPGRIAAASHSSGDREAMFGAGVDLVLEQCQDAADRTVELLSGADTEDRTPG